MAKPTTSPTGTAASQTLANELLLASENRFQQYIARAPLGVFVVDRSGRYLDVNPAAERITGYAAAQLRDMSLSDLLPPESVEAGRAHFQRLLAHGFSAGELGLRRANGDIGWWRITASALDEDRFLGFAEDLSEQRRRDEQTQLLGRMIDDAPVAITVHDDQGRFLFANRETLRLHGYDREDEFLALTLREVDAPKDATLVDERVRAVGERGEARFEVEHYRKDGTTLPLAVLAKRVLWKGTPAVLSIATDVTESRRAEQALRESEQRLSLALRATNDVVWDWDIVGDQQRWNESGLAVFGWADIVDAPQEAGWWLDRVHPDDRQRVEEGFFAAVSNPATEQWRDDYRFRRADGAYAFVADRGHILRDGSGRAVRMIGAMLDVTESRRAEQALRHSRQLLDATEALSGMGGWEWDVATESMTWTDGTYRLHDIAIGAVEPGTPGHVARSLACYDPEDRRRVAEAFRKCVELGEAYDLECGFTTEAGRRLRVRTMGRPVREDGRIVGVVGNLQDVTERTRAEQEHERLQAQVLQSQKMESVGRLAGGVAHDFNNLLMGIMGYTELCREAVPPGSQLREWLDEVMAEAERSANLVRQLLAFARRQVAQPRSLDLNAQIESTLRMLRRLIGERIELGWSPAAALGTVCVDPSHIDQVMVNLCVNAADAIEGTGRIAISTRNVTVPPGGHGPSPEMAPGTYIELAVADSGCGMDEETRTHAFEPFFTTKGVGHGTGLGLATVYGIVSQSAGYAAIDSVPGAGTTIRVYLPVVEEATAVDAPPVRAERTPGGTETILVVDDERSVRATIAAQLARQGYNVLTADTPDMALLVARQHEGPIALLLTDVVMPGMSGVELRARLLVERPGLKTVFMTGYTVTELPGQFSAVAGTMLLAKPIAASDLVATIRTTLGASPGVGH